MNDTNATVSINDATDYLCIKLFEAGANPSVLKVQKLLYYAQAWFLAIHGRPLFNEDFQAWVHGPVCRTVYDRFKSSKSMYGVVTEEDIGTPAGGTLSPEVRDHLDEILENYGEFSGVQLEQLSHQESPWREARKGLNELERSENVISNETMQSYYSAKLK
jgi:uncharacterized phage-associated protein